ncbi:MAG TPA: tRNA pseudouridine(55) synthase TruB, partial [Xanthomonadales bacterium]|nr:tRNA pseudouridine(55) synthase TruB [Xanthomonadales bacterium]
VATLKLGTATATGDTEGEPVDTQPIPELNSAKIESAMQAFRGPLQQVPPMYSAIKQDGRPLYELARQGIVVERQARSVEIHTLELLGWNSPLLEFRVTCSKGTYVRTLAEDLAQALGSCGHLQALRRTAAEPFFEPVMFTLEELESALEQNRAEAMLLPADAGLPDWPKVELEWGHISRFMNGNSLDHAGEAGRVRVYGLMDDGQRHILGLGEIRASGQLHPLRVFMPGVKAKPELPHFS